VLVRGKRVSKSGRKLDIVLVAARYVGLGGQLKVARGYQRRGYVWGDLELIDRQMLIDQLKAKKQVAIGRVAGLPGDFEVDGKVNLVNIEGTESVVNEEDEPRGDDLGLPLF